VGPTITGGLVLHPLDRGVDMLKFYREFAKSVPDELTTVAALLTSPDGHKMAAMGVAYCGLIEDGARAVRAVKEFGTPALEGVGRLPDPAPHSPAGAGV